MDSNDLVFYKEEVALLKQVRSIASPHRVFNLFHTSESNKLLEEKKRIGSEILIREQSIKGGRSPIFTKEGFNIVSKLIMIENAWDCRSMSILLYSLLKDQLKGKAYLLIFTWSFGRHYAVMTGSEYSKTMFSEPWSNLKANKTNKNAVVIDPWCDLVAPVRNYAAFASMIMKHKESSGWKTLSPGGNVGSLPHHFKDAQVYGVDLQACWKMDWNEVLAEGRCIFKELIWALLWHLPGENGSDKEI
ncbi:hypothetical protein [Pelagibaculum spongiae]|uniref:Uncharacterized protein n=1 Tax=Pelagibaculum spongiae TaxID=2080658 RepID=A0A2V1H261_9GAMM|nr:hypothetical protein [Pelagibaculum spongiae]PVZ69760.1 hypothetical protein DC094_10710 [Pelagibaculum spongiae]